MLWLEIFGPLATYVGGGMYAYRRRYTKLYKNWRRWQAENPEKDYSWASEYSMVHKPRKDVDFHRYVWNVQDHTPACLMGFLWPFYLPTKGVKSFLRPEVQVPDYNKIKELEKG